MEKVRIFFSYTLSALIILCVIALNYFHAEIENRVAFIPVGVIPGITFISVIVALVVLRTREKRLEDLKYEFLTVATHKFRTPIAALKWIVEDVRKDQTFTERQETAKQLDGAVDRLREVVELMAGAVRLYDRSNYAFAAVSFREDFEKSLVKYGPVIRKKQIHFNIQIDQSLPVIVIDAQKIQFALDMIIENAIKYTPANGSIDILVKYQTNEILVAVKDSGIGLTKREKARVFARFYRGDEAKKIDTEGLGLGLSIAKVIVENHGGKMWAESDGRGKGTTFFIKLKTKFR